MKIKCECCGNDVTKKIQNLNKKMVSRKTKQFLCINCLANYLETTVDDLNEKMEEFKQEGCTLFL